MVKRNNSRTSGRFSLNPENVWTQRRSPEEFYSTVVAMKPLEYPTDPQARALVESEEANTAFAHKGLWVVKNKQHRKHLRSIISICLEMQRKGYFPAGGGPQIDKWDSGKFEPEVIGFHQWLWKALKNARSGLPNVEEIDSTKAYRVHEVAKILEVERESVYRYLRKNKLKRALGVAYTAVSGESLINFLANEERGDPHHLIIADTWKRKAYHAARIIKNPQGWQLTHAHFAWLNVPEYKKWFDEFLRRENL